MKYYAFYIFAYGYEHRIEVFDELDEVLAFVKKASDDTVYRDLVVIHGDRLEFEPCKGVESYRIKESG